uniref:Baseplate wedge protein n=1 Tax=Pseudomonas phage Cygsa01 TaxID=3138529 RepID=A0AAU6W430_9VIRU
MATKQIVYRDFDLTFAPHPMSGDISMRTNEAAVVQSIKTLVMSMEEEILGAPQIGGGVYGLLFGQAGPLTEVMIQNRIEDTIRAYEPRCDLKSVTVTRAGEGQGYMIGLVFYILNNPEPVEVAMALKRLR